MKVEVEEGYIILLRSQLLDLLAMIAPDELIKHRDDSHQEIEVAKQRAGHRNDAEGVIKVDNFTGRQLTKGRVVPLDRPERVR